MHLEFIYMHMCVCVYVLTCSWLVVSKFLYIFNVRVSLEIRFPFLWKGNPWYSYFSMVILNLPLPRALNRDITLLIKGLSSQSYGFSSSHIWMWEWYHKENWMPKNWCFWTGVLEKTWESLGLQEDQISQS